MSNPITLLSKAPLPLPVDRRGYWWFTPVGEINGLPSPLNSFVSAGCPQCGITNRLRDPQSVGPRDDGKFGHDIAADGTLSPSLVCGRIGCGWHVWAKLDGWKAEDATLDIVEVHGQPITITATLAPLDPTTGTDEGGDPSALAEEPPAPPKLIWKGLIKCDRCHAEERMIVDDGMPFSTTTRYACEACGALAAREVLG